MNLKQKNRLFSILVLLFSLTLALGLILYALRQNINLFFTPSQLDEAKMPTYSKARIKLGGMVEKGSIERSREPKREWDVQFIVTDFNASIKVYYSGILPDLFREGQGMVATGYLLKTDTGWIFRAEEILAKHDENYMPPLIKDLKP